MKALVTRREFATVMAAGASAMLGFDPRGRTGFAHAGTQSAPFAEVPKLDGALLLDEAARKAVALDGGNLFHRVPAAVLRPGTAQDIVKIVKFANRHHLKLVARGHAHSKYGQSQAEGGIVIDTSSLIAIGQPTAMGVDVQPGATIGDILRQTLAGGHVPPVLPNCMQLTAGGFVNAGGMGDTSCRFGAFVDNVVELDVVTGDGRFITCSDAHERELFNMVLGGMGQCGVVVRARLRLVAAKSHVVLQRLTYRSVETYFDDQTRLATGGLFDDLGSVINREADGSWTYILRVGKFCTAAEEPNFAALTSSLHFDTADAPSRVTTTEYHYRDVTRETAAAASRAFHPAPGLTMWIPASAARDFVSTVRSTPLHLEGLDRISITPMNTRLYRRPLFKVPAEEHGFRAWMFRSVPVGDDTRLERVLASNRELLATFTARGAKRYAPYGMVASAREWETHFGPETWRRLSAAKRKFDPRHVLSPEPAMWGS